MKKNNSTYQLLRKVLSGMFLFLLVSSCNESVLDETPADFISTSNAFNSPSDVELGVVGLYAFNRTWFSATEEEYAFCLVAVGTDVAYEGEDPAGGAMGNWSTQVTPTSGYPKSVWEKSYDLIQQCNVILKGIENVKWADENKKNSYISETKFFRAFNYRILVTLFGGVPLQTEPVSSAKTDFVRSSKEDIYALIESDLAFATANLPKRGAEAAAGRATQGAAWHLLSEIFLMQKKYQLAVDAASHVINEYGYGLMTQRFGAKLGKDVFKNENVYFDLFTKENQNLTSNTEAIWVIQNDPDITGGGYYCGERAYGPAYFRLGNTPDGKKAFLGELYNGAYTGYSDTLSRPVAWCRPTNYTAYNIWQSDWSNDFRNSEACIKRNFYFDNPASAYHGKKIEWSLYNGKRTSPFKDTTQYLYPFFMKVATPLEHYTDLARSGGGVNHKDLYAMRLAETYLLRAEGYLGLGKTDLAANDINKVRERSNAKPISAADVTLDYILDERARELYTEEWRMITLMRLGKLVERVRKYNDNPGNPGVGIQDRHNLWPIPQTEIDLNTGAVLEQNPDYN